MTLVTYDFESATPSGTPLTLGNTSANQIVPNGGTATSDNTVDVWFGSLCGKFVAAVNAQCLARFLASASNLTMSFGGGVSIDAQPANAITLGTLRGSGLAIGLRWGTSNTIMIADAAGATTNLVTGATPGSKYFISIRATTTAVANTGTWTINAYDTTGALVGTNTQSSKNIGTAAFTGGDFGVVDTAHAAGVTVRWDNIQFNDGSSTEITPPSSSSNINVTDAAAAADALTVSAAVPVADTASGADALGVAATVPLSDAGAGADNLTVQVLVNLVDAGTGADATPAVTAMVTVTDNAAGSDSVSTGGTPVLLVDTATGADTLGVVAVVPLTDAGATADTLTATVRAPLADLAAAADTLTLVAAVPLTDTGSSADALTVTVRVNLADTAVSVDALTANNPANVRNISVTVSTGPVRQPANGQGVPRHPTASTGTRRWDN